MKNVNLILISQYIICCLCVALLDHFVLETSFDFFKNPLVSFAKDILFVILSGLFIFRMFVKKDRKNKAIYHRIKNASAEIKESNDRYNIVSKATSDTIWDWKIQEDQITWNKGIKGIFGYDYDQVGKGSGWWFDKIHPEDSIRMSVRLYNFIEQKTGRWQDQYRFRCADGTYKYVLDRGFIIKDEEDNPIRMIGAIQDITKQKEEELRLKLLETVINQIKDAIVITEPSKCYPGIRKIVYVNPAFTNASGYNFEEVIGKSPSMFQSDTNESEKLEAINEAVLNGTEYKTELIRYGKNNQKNIVDYLLIPVFNSEKKISHYVSIMKDITTQRKQEKEREQLIRELTKNNKDLKQFSYITSHNLKAPLSNLTGLLNLIEDIEINNPELEEILQGFNKSAQQLNETITDLVNVIVIKDNPSIQKEDLVMIDMFENVFFQLDFIIGMHKPILKLDFEKAPIVHTNKAYLESILLNLLTNALKYRSLTEQVKIQLSTHIEDNNFILVFKDNGIGIDMELNKDKIFGLYQKFHDYPDSKGLGLYLVKSQVEAMGGIISVNSQVNIGTTFTITFIND